uniref:estradiol 17-beta-dehydrogenase 8-like n=1 Tax=Styela clava TaxID=7725 RepID=UPI001939E93A|nr:estradiol 17-beta-dehydrogenase 8-like [Styela clava]
MSLYRLSGKAAIVTGGGSGIGRSVCKVFAREGCSVAVLDSNQDGIAETIKLMDSKQDCIHCSIKADVTSSDQVQKAFKTAEEELGKKVTVLINCAGIAQTQRFLSETEEQVFDDTIRVNLKGTFIMCKQFMMSLGISRDDEDTRGIIVNVSSRYGIQGFPGVSSYCSSKFGVIGLTKTAALEYAQHKVRCNAVLPGPTKTPLLETFPEDHIASLEKDIPMKRIAKPEEVASCILFLACEESSFVNGACLEVTGGYGL